MIVLEVMREDGPNAANGSWARGDVVRVFEPHPNLAANLQCNLPRKAYILITDEPVGAISKLKRWLERREGDGENLGKEFPKKRELNLTITALSGSLRAKLTNPPYAASVTWNSAKNAVLSNKVTLATTTIEAESTK